MTKFPGKYQRSIVKGMMVASTLAISFNGALAEEVKLLTAQFEEREVAQIEIGDFHFLPGQVAPIHTHRAPAVGYVAKGSIIYQVEGRAPQVLREGDAFYEPAGPRILRFDNMSATHEAIFVDFNLERAGEPFIVFEKPPTEAIDRRTLPTIDLADNRVSRVDVYNHVLQPEEVWHLSGDEMTLVYVAEGVVELKAEGEEMERLVAGTTFPRSRNNVERIVTNVSTEVSAELVTFRLQ